MSIEAMRQALELLEDLQGGCTDSDDGTVEALTIHCPEVIANLRAAIEQAEKPVCDKDPRGCWSARCQLEQKCKNTPPAAPRQEHYDQTLLELCEECGWKAVIPGDGCLICARQKAKPVAWMYDFLADDRDEIIRDWTTQEYAEIEREKGFNVRPLYPGPRQWVGLTEEETQALYDRYAVYQEYGAEDSGWFDFARAIEAWLREKNT